MSWLNDGVPEREMSPPEKQVKTVCCPECGSEDLGEFVLVLEKRDIESWYDGVPDRYDDEFDYEIESEKSGSPRYYCNSCGDEFDEPDWEN